MLDTAAFAVDLAHFRRAAAGARGNDPARVRAALKRVCEGRAPPALPVIESAQDILRFVPNVDYLVALLRAAGVDELL